MRKGKAKLRRMKQKARKGKDRRVTIVRQGKARKGETRKGAERYGEVRCAERRKSAEKTLGKIIVKVKSHVMSHEVLWYVTVFPPQERTRDIVEWPVRTSAV